METWKIITNVIISVIILALTIVVIVDYIKHKDDETISAEDLKQLRKSHFIFAMLVAIGFLYSHICRFFVWEIPVSRAFKAVPRECKQVSIPLDLHLNSNFNTRNLLSNYKIYAGTISAMSLFLLFLLYQ